MSEQELIAREMTTDEIVSLINQNSALTAEIERLKLDKERLVALVRKLPCSCQYPGAVTSCKITCDRCKALAARITGGDK